MHKFCISLLLFGVVSVVPAARAQLNPLQSHGVPTGTCVGSMTDVDLDTGFLYACKPPTWILAGGGSGLPAGTSLIYYAAGGGTAQAQTVAPTSAITNASLISGTEICWLPVAANSGPGPTLAGSGSSTFSAKTITKYGTVPLIANDINPSTKNPLACAVYDGTEFQLQNPLAGIIAQTSVQNVSAATQSFTLYPSGGCDGVSACTGNGLTFQAPATITGPFSVTFDSSADMIPPGTIQGINGSAAAPTFTNASNPGSGLWFTSGAPVISVGGQPNTTFTTLQIREAANSEIGFTATSDTTAGPNDTAISRDAPGVLDVGNGTVKDSSAFIRTGNTVILTSNFTTTSASLVTITGLSWSFPAANHNYSFHCRLSYSQATGTAANAFGVQAATTAPTNLYAAMNVSTGLAVTGVDATLPTLNTTTATNIGTFTPSAFGAIGTIADIFTAEIWGTLEQGAGATALNIMALTGNAADALTIYRGSSCTLEP